MVHVSFQIEHGRFSVIGVSCKCLDRGSPARINALPFPPDALRPWRDLTLVSLDQRQIDRGKAWPAARRGTVRPRRAISLHQGRRFYAMPARLRLGTAHG